MVLWLLDCCRRHRHRTARAHGESGLGGLLRSDLLRLEHSSRNFFGALPWATWCVACLWERDGYFLSRCGRISEVGGEQPAILDWYTILTGVIALDHANCARRTLHRSEDRERTEPARCARLRCVPGRCSSS